MKLVTEELEKVLKQYPLYSQDGLGGNAKVIAKFFNPCGVGTWFITEAEKLKNGDYELFGYCHLGDDEMAEFGTVMLSELENIRLPYGMAIERDLYLPEDINLVEAMKRDGMAIPAYILDEYKEENKKDNQKNSKKRDERF